MSIFQHIRLVGVLQQHLTAFAIHVFLPLLHAQAVLQGQGNQEIRLVLGGFGALVLHGGRIQTRHIDGAEALVEQAA